MDFRSKKLVNVGRNDSMGAASLAMRNQLMDMQYSQRMSMNGSENFEIDSNLHHSEVGHQIKDEQAERSNNKINKDVVNRERAESNQDRKISFFGQNKGKSKPKKS